MFPQPRELEFGRTIEDVDDVRFIFGAQYRLVLGIGKTYTFSELDPFIDMMVGAFERQPEYLPQMGYVDERSGANPGLSSKKFTLSRSLQVTAIEKSWVLPDGFLAVPHTPLADLRTTVKQAVVLYSLTGSWGEYVKGNL